jgi:hypothetical protein
VTVTAQPLATGGMSSLDCIPSGAGPYNFSWRGYQDDGTVGGVTFSNPNIQSPTVTLSTLSGNGANFYVFCTVTEVNFPSVQGTGFSMVTLSTGDTIPNITIAPSPIHVNNDVTFDDTPSTNLQNPPNSVAVQYAGNVTPAGLEGYLQLPAAGWTTVFTDNAPVNPEVVSGIDFNAPGAYRVQYNITSSTDFSTQEATFYFQVLP